MNALNWGQVNAWRLSQHNLTHRLQPADLIRAVSRTMGIHAQVMSAAEMAIGARMDGLTPQDVQAALWRDRTLVKTWLMRQTLHLVSSADFPTYVAARRITDIKWPLIFSEFGINRATLDAYLAVAPDILNNGPITRQQFIEAVDEHVKSPQLHNFLAKGSWGTAFKPLAWRGELCFGPSEGQNSTFIRPIAWIGGWREVEPEAAMQEVVRHFLMVYGPSRPRNFQVWWWMSGIAASNAFNSIIDETEEVEVEGWRAIALKSAIQSILEMEPTEQVHLLPAFDVYTIGLARGKDLERLIPLEHKQKVFRLQGWVSAVVLVDGFIKGTWEYKMQHATTVVMVNLFSSVANWVKEGIAAETERLGKFLNTPILLEFSQAEDA